MDFYRPPTTQVILNALGSLYRAIRARRFYPQGHPTRRDSLLLAHNLLRELLADNTLSLICGRAGFSYPDGEAVKDPSGVTAALAFELFVRRVQKITFSPDLFQEDLLELCKILCLSPEIVHSGGMEATMAARGIRSIWVNEFDLAAISRKRRAVEQAGIVPEGLDAAETAVVGPDVEPPAAPPEAASQELPPEKLLERLAACSDDDLYLLLTRQAVACADFLQARQSADPLAADHLMALLELLASHGSDAARSTEMCRCARFALNQIVLAGAVVAMVLERIDQGTGVPAGVLHAVLTAGGAAAIGAAIEMTGRTTSLKTRKIIITALGALDGTAVPALKNRLHDPRWFIVRNICTILGAIAGSETLAALVECLYHPELRVRKEAVRSLAQLGGPEAEEAVIGVLRSADAALYPQAITSLGGLKSRKSLAELLKIVLAKDMFLQSLPLKIDALTAIAAIGDRQVTPQLVKLLAARHLLAAERAKQLKAAVAACLGRLGDVRAVPALKKLAGGSDNAGVVYMDAINMIEKKAGRTHGLA